MPEPAFDTLEAARRLKSAGIDSEHAEAIVEVMGQSVNQLVTREHFDLAVEHFDLAVGRFDATIASLRTELCARIDTVQAELHTRIGGVESNVQSLEATLRTELMRGILIAVGVLIPAIGLMIAIAEFYSARGGGA